MNALPDRVPAECISHEFTDMSKLGNPANHPSSRPKNAIYSAYSTALIKLDYNVMSALHSCRTVKFNSCNNLLPFVHFMLVIVLRYGKLNIKTKIVLLQSYMYERRSNQPDRLQRRG